MRICLSFLRLFWRSLLTDWLCLSLSTSLRPCFHHHSSPSSRSSPLAQRHHLHQVEAEAEEEHLQHQDPVVVGPSPEGSVVAEEACYDGRERLTVDE